MDSKLDEEVRLIGASDSLKTSLSDDSSFSKVLRHPVRDGKVYRLIPQICPQKSNCSLSHTPKSFQNNHNLCYNDLLRLSVHQKQLIEFSRTEIEKRSAQLERPETTAARLNGLREQVAREENELFKLNILQHQLKQSNTDRVNAEKHLSNLQINIVSQQRILHDAFTSIDSLKNQLEVLYRRRLSALQAARDQQRILSGNFYQQKETGEIKQSLDVLPNNSKMNQNATSMGSNLTYNLVTTKASDEPDAMSSFLKLSRDKSKPRASVESVQIVDNLITANVGRLERDGMSLQFPASLPLNISASREANAETVKSVRNESPSPPKDPFPSESEGKAVGLNEEFENIESNSVKNADNFETSNITHLPTFTPARRFGNIYDLGNQIKALDDEPPPADLVQKPYETEINKFANADQVSIRSDTLRATKRRSWAHQESSFDEVEYIRKIICEEQKKGRTHLIIDPHIETLLKRSMTDGNLDAEKPVCKVLDISQKSKIELDESIKIDTISDSNTIKGKKKDEEKSFSSADDDNKSPFPNIVESCKMNSVDLIKPTPEKGILRLESSKKGFRRVVFDPLALLLDASLEGEMDLVKKCSNEVLDLSASNNEGITALHNAICAGHYEIVRFLVCSHADVNAQDSDGWTPLHCAASCNNLPMVKILVEHGACLFAQTLSDHETPIEKCEKGVEGYEGCHRYLSNAAACFGIINYRRIYSAFDYVSNQQDELSFNMGTCLQVIEKDVDGNCWWLCENTSNSQKGLVPLNYLALYPSLKYRNGFIHFEIQFDLSLQQDVSFEKSETDLTEDMGA